MIKSFEIFYRDLNEKAKEEILKFYEIQTPEEGNLDAFPLTVIEIEIEDNKIDLESIKIKLVENKNIYNEKFGEWKDGKIPSFTKIASNI